MKQFIKNHQLILKSHNYYFPRQNQHIKSIKEIKLKNIIVLYNQQILYKSEFMFPVRNSPVLFLIKKNIFAHILMIHFGVLFYMSAT